MVNTQEEDVESLPNKGYTQKSDVFEENKLWIKLKIPKEEDETKIYSKDTKRFCSFCNKAFSSGKALGGHMRIHVQKAHRNSKNKALKVHHPIKFKKHQNPSDQMGFVNKKKNKTMIKPRCMICGKDFQSMKSLFGHMRCHPERVWRGIKPPASMVKNNSYISDSDHTQETEISVDVEKKPVIDLTESLSGWPITARRGRKASISEDDQLHEAVNFLMILSQGKNCDEIFDSNEISSVGLRNEEKGSNEVEKIGVVNGESVNKSDGQDWFDEEDDHEYSSDDDQVDMKKKIRKLCDLKIGKMGIASPVITPPILFTSPDKYRCSICDKSFSTGQALGGHISSHNKIKLIIQNPNPNPNPTNQMGHSQVDSSSGEASHTGRRMLTFDLNEAPPTSTDEIGSDSDYSLGNYGYA